MNKKLFAITFVALFLITSVGIVSAEDDSISIPVKVVWDGDPADYVTVNLLKDDVIVDTVKLNAENSWNATFKVDGDGNYKVSLADADNYTSSISGDAENGFVIDIKLAKNDVLAASDDQSPVDNASDDDNSSGDSNVLATSDDQTQIDDKSDEGSSDNSDAMKADDNGTGNAADNSTDDNSTDEKNTKEPTNSSVKTTNVTKTKTTTTTKLIKQDDKKKPENTTKTKKNNNTGFPIIILVIALVVVVMLIPLSRKK